MLDVDLALLTASNLTGDQKSRIVDSLLNCASIGDPSRREAILRELDKGISNNIVRSPASKVDVMNIVTTCSHYSGGLAQLISVVRFFEGNSFGMLALDDLLRDLVSSLRDTIKEQSKKPESGPQPEAAGTTRARKESPADQGSRHQTAEPTATPVKERPLRVFLSHASEDREAVRELYWRLRGSGAEPWLDVEDLLPGQKWEKAIPDAVRRADVVMICLSGATGRAGYIQKEINMVLDLAEEQPEGTIFVIPVRLEDCDVADRLRPYTWVDLYERGGYERLIRSLKSRAISLGIDANLTA